MVKLIIRNIERIILKRRLFSLKSRWPKEQLKTGLKHLMIVLRTMKMMMMKITEEDLLRLNFVKMMIIEGLQPKSILKTSNKNHL